MAQKIRLQSIVRLAENKETKKRSKMHKHIREKCSFTLQFALSVCVMQAPVNYGSK